MNDKAKAAVTVGLSLLSVFVPGAAPAIAVGSRVLNADHPVQTLQDPNTEIDAAEAAIQTIEQINGIDIANEAQFRAGCAVIAQGFALVKSSLKHAAPESPAA